VVHKKRRFVYGDASAVEYGIKLKKLNLDFLLHIATKNYLLENYNFIVNSKIALFELLC